MARNKGIISSHKCKYIIDLGDEFYSTIRTNQVLVNLTLCTNLREYFFKYPRVMRSDLLVVILMHSDFLETMPLVEFLCIMIRNLNMEIYLADFGFPVRRGRCQD